MLVDDVAGWHRQAPVRLVVKLVERVAKRRVQLLQIRWERESKPERLGHAEVEIRQHVELELRRPAHGPPVLRELRRERDDRGAQRSKLWPYRLQSFQLHHAVGSPVPTEERDHQWAISQQVGGAHELSILVVELERRRQITDLERALGKPGSPKLLGGPVHDLDALAGDVVWRPAGLECRLERVQLLLETHRSPRQYCLVHAYDAGATNDRRV